jgi:hypothetical protein
MNTREPRFTRLFHFFSKDVSIMGNPQLFRKQWTAEEVLHLRKLVRQSAPAQVIARKLGRSMDAVYVKASREGLSLRLIENPSM